MPDPKELGGGGADEGLHAGCVEVKGRGKISPHKA